MSTLFEISGAMRGNAILGAVRMIASKEQRPTVERVHAELPEVMFPGFDAEPPDDDEIAAAMEIISAEADQHVAALERPGEQQAEPEAAAPQAEPPAPTTSPSEAAENLRLAHVALANARAAVTRATNVRGRCREALSRAVLAWQTGLPQMTRTEAVRESIASYQQTRGEQVRRPTPGPSVIDRVAANQRGGPAAWGNFRRGATTVRGGLNFDPRKGPVAKLPSQR